MEAGYFRVQCCSAVQEEARQRIVVDRLSALRSRGFLF
jgi:hypothetical protein